MRLAWERELREEREVVAPALILREPAPARLKDTSENIIDSSVWVDDAEALSRPFSSHREGILEIGRAEFLK